MKNRFAHSYAQRLLLAIVLLIGASEPLYVAAQEKELQKTDSSSLDTSFSRFKKRVRAFIKCVRDKNCRPGTKRVIAVAAAVLLVAIVRHKITDVRHKITEQSRLQDAWLALGNRQYNMNKRIEGSRGLKRKFGIKMEMAEGARLAAYETDPEAKVFPTKLAEAIRLTSELERALLSESK